MLLLGVLVPASTCFYAIFQLYLFSKKMLCTSNQSPGFWFWTCKVSCRLQHACHDTCHGNIWVSNGPKTAIAIFSQFFPIICDLYIVSSINVVCPLQVFGSRVCIVREVDSKVWSIFFWSCSFGTYYRKKTCWFFSTAGRWESCRMGELLKIFVYLLHAPRFRS